MGLNDASLAQRRAARPDASSWVSANAGSGKTRVLTDRVARLLLRGAEPARILCLTYTTAAAAEMQTRLFRTLGEWAMMPDADLGAAIDALGEPIASETEDLDRARTLFARALETPGGLKIQTIHAFCDGLLRNFPLEAGVAPQFSVLDDRQAKALRAETLDWIALEHEEAFAAIAAIGPEDLDPLVQEIARHREVFAAPFDPDRLAATLDAGRQSAFALSDPERRLLAQVAEIAGRSGPKDSRTAAAVLAALSGPPRAMQEALEGALLYGATAKSPFGPKTDFPTKALRTAHADLCVELDGICGRVAEARAERVARAAWERSQALNVFARIWLEAYAARKAARGSLDFDDLIDRACALLSRSDVAAWVLWRLDGGIDHILVDEAQDTSPAQWSVIAAITDEFFAGRGARDLNRTLFVVGDEKQSIYSFQGADPAAFGGMRRRFSDILEEMGGELARCDLLWSFRSAKPILNLVDAVFTGKAGGDFATPPRHLPIDPEAPGRVEIWPFLEKPEKEEESPWDLPREAAALEDPAERLAERIAGEIRGWLDEGRGLPGAPGGRAIRPGDVLILVQRRGAIFDATIRALKRQGVPVAGADLLRVGAELAVRDLLAALKAVAVSADDLSLAAALRSPLGGMSERSLFELAHGRRGTLWQALAQADPAPPVRDTLRDLRAQADFLRPYELLQRLLIRHDGRRQLIARLGAEAEDGIDALLEQSLAYESVEPPTLIGFLSWIERDEVKVKRRMEAGLDQVRVMTVHGAKGLEAPIVILPDTAQRQEGRNPPRILSQGGAALWRTQGEESPPLIVEAERLRRERASAENRRLLYVALTRARTWLIVAGAGTAGPDSWHCLAAEALAALSPETEDTPLGDRKAISHNWSVAGGAVRHAEKGAVCPPAWLQVRASPVEDVAILSPSRLGGAHALPGEGLDTAEAQAWGSALHVLLERLPETPRSLWPEAASRLLPATIAAQVLEEALGVLETPEIRMLFSGDALAEVDIAGPVAALGGRIVAGRIDRLVVSADAILAVDFKSNRVVPKTPAETPEAILRQMGAYAAALTPIWPGRRIETAILWTRARRLVSLPSDLTDAALHRAASEVALGPRLDPAEARP
jgi:ATP-dependent helicase/nuclease subunit A